jgi:protein-disulfide isomerase
MASRKEQKEAARQRRLAEERARAQRARRDRRVRLLGGVVLGAVALVAVAIAVSSGGSAGAAPPKPNSPAAKQAAATVSSLLAGIPQDGTRIGSPAAKVTVTEWGDLECPICKDFALSTVDKLIPNDVRSGKVQLIYRSFPTATGNGPDPGVFPTQQAAALAAGNQKLAWNYILLFYHEQGAEDTSYVTPQYLGGLAKQIPGLNFSQWNSDRQASSLTAQVDGDETAAKANGFTGTPTIVVRGPRSQTQPVDGDITYGSLESLIKSVS